MRTASQSRYMQHRQTAAPMNDDSTRIAVPSRQVIFDDAQSAAVEVQAMRDQHADRFNGHNE